jgi:hypothetical protein
MEVIRSSETSVHLRTTRRYIPEDNQCLQITDTAVYSYLLSMYPLLCTVQNLRKMNPFLVGFEVLTALTTKGIIFWNVTPYVICFLFLG